MILYSLSASAFLLQASRFLFFLADISLEDLQIHHLEVLQVVHNRSNRTGHPDCSDHSTCIHIASKCETR